MSGKGKDIAVCNWVAADTMGYRDQYVSEPFSRPRYADAPPRTAPHSAQRVPTHGNAVQAPETHTSHLPVKRVSRSGCSFLAQSISSFVTVRETHPSLCSADNRLCRYLYERMCVRLRACLCVYVCMCMCVLRLEFMFKKNWQPGSKAHKQKAHLKALKACNEKATKAVFLSTKTPFLQHSFTTALRRISPTEGFHRRRNSVELTSNYCALVCIRMCVFSR